MGRRGLLATLAVAAGSFLAGCADAVGEISAEPHYDEGTVEDVDGPERTVEEMATAEALAEQNRHEGVTPLERLEITDHEFVLEDDFRGPTVQGVVENGGDDRVEVIEVRVRVFDEGGRQLGRYLDHTGDLGGETTWAFEVVLLESPAEIADYDVAVLGTPT